MTSPNPLFTEQFTPYEQYIMFVGYMDRVHAEMCRVSGGNKNSHELDHMVMGVLNKKVVDMLFPDGNYDFEMIKHIGAQMKKLKLTDRTNQMLNEITGVLNKYGNLDIKDPRQIKSIMRELME